MNAKEFLERFGREEAERVAALSGTNYAYFSQLAYGHRRPSVDLAERLVAASDGRLDFTKLLLKAETAA
tara:strand:- start:3102 stop:3308 length:207 start_codon:yes stop_codon:yes gene_type:complete